MPRLLLPCVLALGLAACATTSGGSGNMFPGDAQHEAAAMAATRERASFDLDCSEIELQRLGDVTRLGQQMTTMSLGARGCEHKATYYVECVSNWGKITCTARLNSKE